MRLHHLVHHCLQFVSPEACQNHDGLHIGIVHDLDHTLGWHAVVDARCIVHVVVHVDHVKARLLHFVVSGVQHRHRLEVFQEKCLLLFGIGVGLVTDLILRSGLRHRECQRHRQNPGPARNRSHKGPRNQSLRLLSIPYEVRTKPKDSAYPGWIRPRCLTPPIEGRPVRRPSMFSLRSAPSDARYPTSIPVRICRLTSAIERK